MTFISLLCLITVPALAMDDACTKPKEFTVDKRCYVTAAQKKQKPFNATVALVDGGIPYCTGTIVKGFGGYKNTKATAQDKDTIFLYTAKHCTDNDNDDQPDRYLDIELQNGDVYKAEFVYAGNFTTVDGVDKYLDGDYALYKILHAKSDIPYTTVRKWGTNGFQAVPARVIGYGALKIMSDAEIRDFRYKYLRYLGTREEETSVKKDLESDWAGMYFQEGYEFLDELEKKEPAYFYDLFDDEYFLKVSKCTYFSTTNKWNCQTWGGNSGGGIFDNAGNLVGIHTRGAGFIGGALHANGHEFKWIQKNGEWVIEEFFPGPFDKGFQNTNIPIAF